MSLKITLEILLKIHILSTDHRCVKTEQLAQTLTEVMRAFALTDGRETIAAKISMIA